jgi:integrase
MGRSCGYWIERFREDFLQRGRSETSWKTDYQKILKRLPVDASLNAKVLHSLVLSTPINSKTRKRACMVTKSLAKFAGISYDPSPYAGKYSPQSVNPRQIPSDEVICEWFNRLTNPGWRWVYGVIATYGLRPHEAFRLDLQRFQEHNPIVLTLPNTKTGSRMVWAFHPEWVERFNLFSVHLPGIDLTRPNIKNGESASHYFGDFGLPFHLYDLRHRWAIRTLEYGLDIGLAAKQMGHSREVHDRIYHHWIEESVQQRAYEALLNRADRPKPP